MKIAFITLGLSLILTACSSSSTIRTADSPTPQKTIVTANKNADRFFDLGREQEEKKHYYKAAEQYKKAVSLGSSKAKNNLGYFYQKGLGVTKDPIKAFKLYKQAAEETGHKLPIRNLANMYYFGLTSVNKNDSKKAAELYKIARFTPHLGIMACPKWNPLKCSTGVRRLEEC